MRIVTMEEFWTIIDELRMRKGMSWRELVSGNAKLAIRKKWNLSLENILSIQKKLDVTLIKNVDREEILLNERIQKDPATSEKMNQIYQWICAENWMRNEEIVEKVQKLAKTII